MRPAIRHQRAAAGAFDDAAVAVTEAELGVAARREIRPFRQDVDGAADRILAPQRALRAAQHFHARQVEQRRALAEHAVDIHVVDVEADQRQRGGGRVVAADAAQEPARALAAFGRLAGEVGYIMGDVVDDAQFVGLHGVAAECRHCHRRLLDAGGAARCRHQYLLHLGAIGGIGRRTGCQVCRGRGGGVGPGGTDQVQCQRHADDDCFFLQGHSITPKLWMPSATVLWMGMQSPCQRNYVAKSMTYG